MTKEEIISELEDVKHISSYSSDEDEFGLFTCCMNMDFEEHKPDCKRAIAMDEAIKIIKET